ncbi:MAG: OmpA family protein [Proteobacteria bacterium]|nr:OmpA family protein [Pseudomonadota bacterium]
MQQQVPAVPPAPGAPPPQRPVQQQVPAVPPTPSAPPPQRPVQQQVPAVPPAPAAATSPPAPAAAATPAAPPRRLEELRGARQQSSDGSRITIREVDRTIIREDGRQIIRHNETARFRHDARDVDIQRRGDDTVTIVTRPDGTRIISVVDGSGRLLRRVRREPDGREIVIIDNAGYGPPRSAIAGYFIHLPPPIVRIPREVYIREATRARPEEIFATLLAPPVERIERRYLLDEIRYSQPLRERMPRVDLDSINFEFGSWAVPPDQVNRLAVIANGMMQAIARNPREVFLIEGHTDAVGADVDNLSLSDRRAESVAIILTEQFRVPPENLTTQGYGEQYLKIPTDGPERLNRRVTVRRITPLLSGQN